MFLLLVLCHQEGHPAGCQHSGEGCSLCDELGAQAETPGLGQFTQGHQTQRSIFLYQIHTLHLFNDCILFNTSLFVDLVVYGVGYHHAGMDIQDRKMIETLFTAGELPVLCKPPSLPPTSLCVYIIIIIFPLVATSTLAMGVSHCLRQVEDCCYLTLFLTQVNLPAHLVVIKSTMHYFGGMFQECSESQILQMIGRAGRPQVCRAYTYMYSGELFYFGDLIGKFFEGCEISNTCML